MYYHCNKYTDGRPCDSAFYVKPKDK